MESDRRTFAKQAGAGLAAAGVGYSSEPNPADGSDPKPLRPDRSRLFATAKRAMVSTSHQYATEAALDTLRKGGNAVDAYLTAALVQTVVEPEMTTLAGALGITFYDAKAGQVLQLGGGYAKPKAETDVFGPRDYTTGRTVMVPGFVAAAHAASRRWGKLAWRDLFEPAIHHANAGVPVDHLKWGWAFEQYQWLGRYPEGREIWFPEGHLLSVGQMPRQPRLAATLGRLGQEGPDYFYRGDWARKFAQSVQARGGALTLDDLASFAGVTTEQDAVRESQRLSAEAAKAQTPPSGHSDAVVVVDAAGNMAALTHSINAAIWGWTGIVVDGVSIADAGCYMHDLMHKAGPGTRLPDPTNPLIVLKDGAPFVWGASVGQGLHENTLQILVNLLDYGQDPQAALDSPQFGRSEWDDRFRRRLTGLK